jgi:hypothetical protein
MKSQIKLWLRRWALRSLIKLVDRAEERLQAWQVSLRGNLNPKDLAAGCNSQVSPRQRAGGKPLSTRETFLQWEARKSGVAPIAKKRYRIHHRRRAADFDARFEAPSPKPKEYLQ